MAKKKQIDRVREASRKPLQVNIYKNMVVTFREFFEVLQLLGYTDKSDATHYRWAPRK
jgi:hypothetical protein